ncbi:hypothetical protein AKJ16_DCAP21219 [Drosera capensis]
MGGFIRGGRGTFDRLGTGSDDSDQLFPVPVSAGEDVKFVGVAAGSYHSLALAGKKRAQSNRPLCVGVLCPLSSQDVTLLLLCSTGGCRCRRLCLNFDQEFDSRIVTWYQREV